MKKHLLLSLFFSLFLIWTVQAQDVILKTGGTEVKAKVVEITLSQVRFKLPDAKQDSLHVLERREVFMITFSNGAKEVLHQETAMPADAPLTPTQMASLGRKEAKLYYKGTGAMVGSAVSTWLFWPAIVAIGAVPPKINPAEVSDVKYLADPYYATAYKKQAHRRKIGKVAVGTGIGVLTISAVYALVVLQMK